MTATWPLSLPQRPLVMGAAGKGANVVLRTEMEAGAAKARRRYTAGVQPLSLTYRLDGSQFDALEAFVAQTLAGGALPFLLPDPWGSDGATITVRLIPPYEWRAVASAGRRRDVALPLEQMP